MSSAVSGSQRHLWKFLIEIRIDRLILLNVTKITKKPNDPTPGEIRNVCNGLIFAEEHCRGFSYDGFISDMIWESKFVIIAKIHTENNVKILFTCSNLATKCEKCDVRPLREWQPMATWNPKRLYNVKKSPANLE